MTVTAAPPSPAPRTFGSPGEALADVAGVARRVLPIAGVYLRGDLDPELRERVMVAVSQTNACRGCSRVHKRWAIRTGVGADELESIGLGDLASLSPRSRAAVLYATEAAEARFRRPVPAEVAAYAGEHLTSGELDAVDAIARMIALANLSASTTEELLAKLPG
ncbi:MAG: carboxymuconolactone decarboxylase family protein [Solirubrobacterales bacterium]|nr:carboxymuconolactone decarboxylase family protein [Solirubrobacterales bacterium]